MHFNRTSGWIQFLISEILLIRRTQKSPIPLPMSDLRGILGDLPAAAAVNRVEWALHPLPAAPEGAPPTSCIGGGAGAEGPLHEGPSSEAPPPLESLRRRCLALAEPLTAGHIWQREGFTLLVAAETKGEGGGGGGVGAAAGTPTYLYCDRPLPSPLSRLSRT